MKRFFRIFAVLIIGLFIILSITPVLFQGKITETLQTQANNNLNATMRFESLKLSWFSSFPDFSVGIEQLSVSGKGEFALDTLLYFPRLKIDIDPVELITSSKIAIKGIYLDRPVVYIKTLPNGQANYDIALPEENPVAENDTSSDDLIIHLNTLIINHGLIVYDDYDLDLLMSFQDLNTEISGDLSAASSDLNIKANAAFVNFIYEGLPFLSDVALDAKLSLGMDMDRFRFSFKENRILLNQLPLSLDGWFEMPDEDMTMDLKFGLAESSFKQVLSLIPALYTKDFEELQAFGEVAFTGWAKGTYSQSTIPGFGLDMGIDNGLFKYPDLPRSAENIKLKLELSNPGGDADNTRIDLKTFHMDFGRNPIDMKLHVETPVSDPALQGNIQASIDFSGIKDVVPVQLSELEGLFDLHLEILGQLSDLENNHPERFRFSGSASLNNGLLSGPDLPERIRIPGMDIRFSSDQIEVKRFDLQAESFDFSLKGLVENYLPYLFRDSEVLKANFSHHSDRFDASKLMNALPTDTLPAGETESELSAFEIPQTIDAVFESSITDLRYDPLNISNFDGTIRLRDGKALLDNLSMNTLDGTMALSGSYDSNPADHELVDLKFDIKNINPVKAFEKIKTIQRLVPLAQYCEGKLSAAFTFRSQLDQKLNPVLETSFAEGFLRSEDLAISGSELFANIANLTGNPKFKNPALKNMYTRFVLKDGELSTGSFSGTIAGIPSRLKGKQNISGSLNYTLEMDVPASKLSELKTGLIPQNFLSGSPSIIPVDAQIKGTLNQPKVSLSLARFSSGIGNTVKETVKNEITNQAEKIQETIDTKKDEALKKARKEADKILIEADKAAEKLITEANKKAQQLEDAAKNKSMIEKQLAKKAADKIRNEAREKAEKIKADARKKADELIQQAS